MTDTPLSHRASAVQARLDALERRRDPTQPAAGGRPATPRRPPARQHPAHGSRVGVAAFGVAATLGLVGALALARPDTSASSPSPMVRGADAALPTPAVPVARSAAGTPTPPVTLTVTPTVRAGASMTAAPTARTHGSH